jgi:hypothetical protein
VNHQFFNLTTDGQLNASDYWKNHNVNFNSFNVDLGIIWRFAPGSELTLVWKNSILNQDNNIPENYLVDLKNTFDCSQTNSLSLKAIYYFDYGTLKNKNTGLEHRK